MKAIPIAGFLILATCIPAAAQERRIELFSGVVYQNMQGRGGGMEGWTAAFMLPVRPWAGAMLEGSASYSIGIGAADLRRSDHSFIVGPQFPFRVRRHVVVFARALVGVSVVSVSSAIISANGFRFSVTPYDRKLNALKAAIGGGADFGGQRVRARIALDYLPMWMDVPRTDNVRISAGLVMRF